MGLYRKRTVASAEGRLGNGQAAVGVGHDHHRIIFHFQTRGYLVIPCRHRLRHAHEVLNGVHGMCAQVDERSSTALLHAEKMWGQPLIDGAGMCNVGSQQGNLSEPTFGYGLLNKKHSAACALREGYAEPYLSRTHRISYLIGLNLSECQHLFCKNVFARFCSRNNHFGMHVGRCVHDDCINILPIHCRIQIFYILRTDFLRPFAPALGKFIPHHRYFGIR